MTPKENIITIIAPAEGLSKEISREEAQKNGVPQLLEPLVSEEIREHLENLGLGLNSEPYGRQRDNEG